MGTARKSNCTATHLHVYRPQCQHEEGVAIKVKAGAEERGGVQQAVRDVQERGPAQDEVGPVRSAVSSSGTSAAASIALLLACRQCGEHPRLRMHACMREGEGVAEGSTQTCMQA